MSHTNCVLVQRNDVTPVQQIALNQTDTDAEPPTDVYTPIDYDTLTPAQKLIFDDCMNMILGLVP